MTTLTSANDREESEDQREIDTVLACYDLAEVTEVTVHPSTGNTNQTYLVTTEGGNFILQAMNPALAHHELGKDFLTVTSHLQQKGFHAARCILNREGRVLTEVNGRSWRMQTCLIGKSFDKSHDLDMMRNAAALLAAFQKATADLRHNFSSLFVLHETRKEVERLEAAAAKRPHLTAEASVELEFLLSTIPGLYLPGNLPQRVIHGDPKISNVLFDDAGTALAMIDLDHCTRSSVLFDIGDAVRSWCLDRDEQGKVFFRKDVYAAILEGYLTKADFLSKEEIKLLPRATACIMLELGVRYLADYYNDSFYNWDSKKFSSRREANLSRCRRCIDLYKDFVSRVHID